MSKIQKRAKKILNLKQYNNYNTPENVSVVRIACPYERQYILRMLVKVAYEEFKIPAELNWLLPLLNDAVKYQKEVIKINHSFCYITVRHGLVESVTDDEWHVDGFSMQIDHIPEQNYGWANCYPTEYISKPIKFPKDFDPLKHNIQLFFQDNISDEDTYYRMPEDTLFCFDPYVIHRRPKVPEGVVRTFVRISFDPLEIMDINNTPNPLLPRNNTRDAVKEFRDKLIRYTGSIRKKKRCQDEHGVCSCTEEMVIKCQNN